MACGQIEGEDKMKKEDYLNRLKSIKEENTKIELKAKKELRRTIEIGRRKENLLKRDFAFSNNTVSVGDIVTDGNKFIKVDRILCTTADNFPECLYLGVLVTNEGLSNEGLSNERWIISKSKIIN
jgi:hypothetical protein